MIEKLLILEDDIVFAQRLKASLVKHGFQTREARNIDEMARLFELGFEPTHALLDLRLAEGSGMEAIPLIRRANASARVVLLSSYGSVRDAVEALRLGADDFLIKPALLADIIGALRGELAKNSETPPELPLSLARVEWEHLQNVLRSCGGNISECARLLGIERRTLQRKLQKFPPPR